MTRSLDHLLSLHPVVAASVAEDWANDVRYLAEASAAVDRAYDRLNGPMMTRDRNHYWNAWKTAQREYADRINEASPFARRVAYAADWFRF